VVLGKWYAGHSNVRRSWALSDDIYPAWLANGQEWAHELQLLTDRPAQLEVIDDVPFFGGLAAGIDGVLIAELFWRDSSMLPGDPLDVEPGNHSMPPFR
jgi:hypothetical protein